MAESPSRLPPPRPEHRRIAADGFERARQVAQTGNLDYAIQLLLNCCKLDPANLIYRRELRAIQKRKHGNNLRGSRFAWFTTAGHKAKLKSAKRRNDHAKVLEHGEDILCRNPWDKPTQLDMAESAEALGLLDVAVFILDQARQKNPLDATVNRAMARLLEQRGNFLQAIKVWELVKQADPSDVEAQHKAKDLAASETIKRGQYEEAIASESPRAMVIQQNQQAAADRQSKEMIQIETRITEDPTDAAQYLRLAESHRKAGKLDLALQVLQQGLGPTGHDFRIVVEIAELELEPFRQNLVLTEEKLKQSPGDPELSNLRVMLLKEINARELELYRLKSDRHPNDPSHRLELGVRLLRSGAAEEAIPELQLARKDEKFAWKASLYLGHAFKSKQNWRLALRNFEEALKAVPKSDDTSRKEILFQLAQGCADHGELARAVDLAHELANLDYGYRNINRLLDEWQAKL